MSAADSALLDEVGEMMDIVGGADDPRFDAEGMLRTARLLRLRSQTAIQVAKVAGVAVVLDWVARTRPDGRIPPIPLPFDPGGRTSERGEGLPVGDPYVD